MSDFIVKTRRPAGCRTCAFSDSWPNQSPEECGIIRDLIDVGKLIIPIPETVICACCKTDATGFVHYELVSTDGEKATVCDTCYQDVAKLEKRDGKWIEVVILGDKEYFK